MERSQLAVVSAIHDDADTQKLLGELENAGDPLEVLTAIARWAGRPEIYAWLMLPVTGAESAVYLVSQHTLPKQNVRGLIEEFLYAVGSTASAYGASVPASDVIEIRNAALHEGGNWQPMIGAAFNDVGLVARGKLRAVVRICFSGDGSPDIAAIAQDVARIAAPYVDACLLACSAGSGQPEQSRPAFLSCTEFRHRLDAEVAGIRQKPHELSLLRVKLQPRKEVLEAAEVERA